MTIMNCVLIGSLIDQMRKVKNDIKIVGEGNLKDLVISQEFSYK